LRILIGHERFGHLRDAFRRRGHEAWSCDIAPDVVGSPFHIQDDILNHLDGGWDMAAFFPDCTFLTVSAAWAFKDGPYHQKVKPETLVGHSRRYMRIAALDHVEILWNCRIPKVAIENPARSFISTMSKLGPASQIIHPNMFGHDASKATGLWKRKLPDLVPTELIAPRYVNGKPRWGNQTDSGQNRLSPADDRAMKRAETYLGVADAMAEQWGST
jgi:hypothetical protein